MGAPEKDIGSRAPGVVARTALYERLSAGVPAGVTLVSAPPGSGKTVLLRSWIDAAGLGARTAWVLVERNERDAQRFWLSVVARLRSAIGGDGLVQQSAPTPEFDGDGLVRRLISELEALEEPIILVIDDLQELGSPDAQAQLELLLARRPRLLHVVLITRHDPSLGLHRLRLAGELTELRAVDLRLSAEEARELLDASGVELSSEAAAMLLARTEGWAAGLRLATMSLAGHRDPERFVAEFAGSERTVADYLLAEVLDRQPERVKRLLLRTSILERVCGPLADRLTGASGSERTLLELEDANAFVVALDAERTWFRYHPLFADLLLLEVRRSEPEAIRDLHRAAADWLAEHGHAVEAIRQAQAAGDWERARHLLADHALSLSLDGQVATIGALLAAFPADARSHPELAALLAFVELTQHSLDTAAAYIALAERRAPEVLSERQDHFAVTLAVVRLELARRRGDLEAALHEVGPLLEPVEAGSVTELTLSNDARAVALMNLGIAELWSFRLDDAKRHLEQGLALARLIDRPHVQVGCLSHLALDAARHSLAQARQRCQEAIAIAEAHGWATDPVACTAFAMMASADSAQGRFDEGNQWLERAERSIRAEPDPATALFVRFVRGELLVGEGRFGEALGEFLAAARLQDGLATAHALTGPARVSIAQTQLRMGDVTGARATVASLTERDHEFGEARTAIAAIRLAEGDQRAVIEALAPVLDGTSPVIRAGTVIQALMLDAVARDQLGDRVAAEHDIEAGLDIAEADSLVFPFVVVAARDLLERHPRHRTAHAALLADLLSVLGGSSLPPRRSEPTMSPEPLSESELRVLRFLPSNLSAGEIAGELYVSTSTVKTHMRHIYEKLDAHRRTEAVDRARDLGLLGPSARSGR
jgi:LuxR family transcriptional regulator, maltose regulon positive regulatory protein